MEDAEIERLVEQALEALEAEEHPRALALLDQLLAARPDDPTLHFWQSRVLLALDRPEDALAAARKAVTIMPELVEAYMPLSWAAAAVGRLQEAQVAYERALVVCGRSPEVLGEYAFFLAVYRGPKVAVEVAEEAIKANDEVGEAWVALGWAQFRMNRYAEAEVSLQRALSLEPDNSRALIAMSELLNRTGRPEKAAALAELLRDSPETAEIADALRAQADNHLRYLPPGGATGDAHAREPVEPTRGIDWPQLYHTYGRVMLWIAGGAMAAAGVASRVVHNVLPLGVSAALFVCGLVILVALVASREG